MAGSKKLEQFGFWRYDFTFTEHDSFFHMSYGLSEWPINLSTTYYIRVRSCPKTKLWKIFSVICLKKYWRKSVIPSGKIPSIHSNKTSPKWQHPENTDTAMEQDGTVHVNINFCVWHARYIFQYTKHWKTHRKIGTLPLYGALGLLETYMKFSPFPLRMHRNLVVVQNSVHV